MNTQNTIPPEVAAWVDSHKGSRVPLYSEGSFDDFAYSKTSACWGQPLGGTHIGLYKIAVCQPSPRRKDDPAAFLFDFIKV